MRALGLAFLVLLATAAPAAAQGLTVYSSLPLQGSSASQTKAMVAGAKLALQDAGGVAAGRPVRYVSLDDSTRQAGTWTPEKTSANARRAAQDPTAVGYIGEFNSGASAISLPILNEAGILQVSPSNTAVGLTEPGFGADKGEPDKYYPAGTRTYGRILPNDQVQARAIVAAMQADGVKSVTVASDGEVYGAGMAQGVAATARARGIRVIAVRRVARGARNAGSIANVARRGQAFFYGGVTANGAVRLFNAVHRRKRALRLYAGDGVAEQDFGEGITRSAGRRTTITVATLMPSSYPAAGQAVFRRLGRNPDPYGIYGYEAMAVVLDAINRGGGDRAATVAAFFATKDRDSVLGRYSIDPNGDTTSTQYGRYRVSAGELRFAGVLDAGQ